MNSHYRCAVQIKAVHNVCDWLALFELFKFFNDNLLYKFIRRKSCQWNL